MTVWRKIENDDKYAVAIFNFVGSSTAPQLSVEVGEIVQLERETDTWYWGKSLSRNASGAFPKTYVVIRDCVVERCGDTVVASSGGRGVVHDIAVTLREWLHEWKKFYLVNDDRFQFITTSMRALLDLRAQAASGTLPLDQLRKVARFAVFTIDKGNRVLERELSVRAAGGQLVDPLTLSAYKLNALHEETNTLISKNKETTPGAATIGTSVGGARSVTVAVRVHNLVCRGAERAELLLALHDASGARLTEHLLLRWPFDHLHSTQVVFTDLSSDTKREKIFLVGHVVRIGSMEVQNSDNRRSLMAAAAGAGGGVVAAGGAGIRRPFGVACGDVTRHLAAPDPEKHLQLPFYPWEKETMDTLLKKVITNRDLKDTKHTQGLWVSLHLVDGSLKQIREENPHLVVGNTVVARKMGFPEVILPGDTRNDLYVTLCSGSFSKGGKTTDRNIEVCARVVDKNGKTLPGVISIGAGVPLVDEYTSLVYYHDDRPRWQEVFKVCLNIEQFKEAHLVFLCRHRSSKEAKDKTQGPFALSYLRLMQREGTTTPDRTHNLCVYKINSDGKRAASDAERAAAICLGLPARRDELPAGAERGLVRDVLSLVHRDCFTVATKLCSTKLTQREEILGVLKWNTHHAEGTLRIALTKLLQVPSEELVKFLQDILDALFNILTQVEEDQEGYSEESYGVLVLDSLLRVISIVADHKYQHFQPVLHEYIDNSFCDALAYEKLISLMVWVIDSGESGDTALKRLLQCMKCLECLVRVIVRSRELRSALGDHRADANFKYLFENLMEALVWLMRCGDPLLTCQGSALKYLPHAVPHAVKVYPDTELSGHVVRALEALPSSRLSKQRLLSVVELVRGPLAVRAGPRSLLLPHVARTARALLIGKVEWEREAALKSRSVDKAARLLGADMARLQDHSHHQQIVELCVETLGELVTLLGRDDVGPVQADRVQLARLLLPTLIHVAASMLRDREEGTADEALLRRVVSVVLDVMRQMTDEGWTMVEGALRSDFDLRESGESGGSLVPEGLALLVAVLRRPVFRPHWADMLHLQHYVMLHTLRLLGKTLLERLQEAEGAMECVWTDWFGAACALATSPALSGRSRRQLVLYGDLRRDAAALVANMWFSLGEHKRMFIPGLVGPFLEVSFICDEEVRNTMIPLFFDMMQTEYSHSVANGEEGNMKELESELIDKLDVLVSAGGGDSQWRARFVSLCGSKCAGSGGELGETGAALVAAAARQLDTLLQYRAAPAAGHAQPQHRMHLLTTVLHFYKQIDRPHMYIRYVHKLAEMHREASQWCEAGLALRLHATLLDWRPDSLPARLRHPARPVDTYSTHRELKEALYLEVAELLNRGRQWELAVEAVKELVHVYEEEALGYGPLAELHAQLSQLYGAMLRTPRSHPAYYRVMYHGRGFPAHLRVPHGFVYRGNEYEQLHDFHERLLDEWPEAEVLLKLDPPGDDIIESDGQYLQINAVTPLMGDKLKRLSGKPIAEQILQYNKNNNVDKFHFSRPFHKAEEPMSGSDDEISGQNEFATRWLERTEIVTEDKLPGILKWSPVVSQRTYWVSPVEAAVEVLREANRGLKSLILEAKAPDAPLQPLTMRLSGILDPAVQGGIVNYERAFLTPRYERRHPQHAALLAQLKDLIADQIPLLKFGLEVHEARHPPALEALHAHMLSCFRRIQHHVHQRYGRKMCEFDTESSEVQLRMSMRNTDSEPRTVSQRISDISTGNESGIKSRFFSFNSAINPLARNSSAAVTSYFGTLQSTPKRRKRRPGKSDMGSQSGASQWYTSPSNGTSTPTNVSANTSANSNGTPLPDTPSASPLRELRQEVSMSFDTTVLMRERRGTTAEHSVQSAPHTRLDDNLVTERPLRAEAERRHSQRASLLAASAPPSNRDSMGTTDSNHEEEEPPPLPEKISHRSLDLDTENNNHHESTPIPLRYNYDMVFTPRGSFLYNSMAQRRNTTACDKPPTPPPKKKNSHNNI